MAAQLAAVDKKFDSAKFVKQACAGLSSLEFNARVKQFADAMASTLPARYPQAVSLVKKSLPEPLPDCDSVTDGWLQWPVGQFIADYGLDYFDESMDCMVELTKRFSAEFAVRPFVEHYPDKTFKVIYGLLEDESPHVRRWCSEGTRTRLPWGAKLKHLIEDPAPIIPILDALKDDSERYVQKSVANSLNDLAKDHPTLVVDLCRDWKRNSNPGRNWVVKQGLRSLIKQGDRGALKLSGYATPKKIDTRLATDKKRIKIDSGLKIIATLTNGGARKQDLLLDYAVNYQGKNEKIRRKVFKWTTLTLGAGESLELNKQHSFKPTTIRALYPGKHSIEIQLNGETVASTGFTLTK